MPIPCKTVILPILALLAASPVAAMDRYGRPAGDWPVRIADPDARLERLAAAATPADGGHGKPRRGVRGILRDDAQLRAAFASLDNR